MNKMRLYFVAFFVVLAVPCSILLLHTYSNLEQESFFHYRKTAEGVLAGLQQSLARGLADEEQRPYTQYRYVHVADQPVPRQEGLNLSPLAAFPVQSGVPGILGYFQIDPDNSFHSPLLPDGGLSVNAPVPQYQARSAVRDKLAGLLKGESFSLAPPVSKDRGAERLEVGSEEEKAASLQSNLANFDQRLEREFFKKKEEPTLGASDPGGAERADNQSKRLQKSSPRQAMVFESQAALEGASDENPERFAGAPLESRNRLREAEGMDDSATGNRRPTAERLNDGTAVDAYRNEGQAEVAAEVDPFRTKLLDDEWLAFYRKVWWRDRRYIQGFVAHLSEFLEGHLEPSLRASTLPESASFSVFYRGEPIGEAFRINETRHVEASPKGPPKGDSDETTSRPLLLLSSNLPHPFNDFHLAATLPRLPRGPGHRLVDGVALFLILMVVIGLVGMYRLTSTQIELSKKKSDFVAAVGHELKTPLASIHMYGEMLVEGWVDDEEKKRTYYRHIHQESERLSRLIHNVLCLAELERNQWPIHLTEHDPVQFVQGITQRLSKQAERAGFELVTSIEDPPDTVRIDPDALTQILINLIDNAIKFSKDTEVKKVVLGVSRSADGCLISVRDFGPGIPRRRLKKIFQKFYRLDNELTRRTRGTGIGLALVKMLADAMGARIEVANLGPGIRFCILFSGEES